MQIINPKVELLEQGDSIVAHVARCARVCYDKETGNDEKLYNSLINNHHWSVFRHVTYYAIATHSSWDIPYFISDLHRSKQKVIGIDIKEDKGAYYIVYNGNWVLDYPKYHKQLSLFHKSPEEFANTETGHSMMRYTFKITTQISTSRELNRVSPNSITEMSSRYVDLKNGAICRPYWMTKEDVDNRNNNKYNLINSATFAYINSCAASFQDYKELIETYGFRREDARGVLPFDTATKVIYTYSIKEWTDIINKRVKMITGRAHENAKIIINMVKKELEGFGYDFE